MAESGALETRRYEELLSCGNLAVADMAMKCEQVFSTHERAHVGISGGADSDVMLDLCERVRAVAPIELVYDFEDTGLEWDATRRHLDCLEDRYGIRIQRTRPVKSIPVCARTHGQPFVSKLVSQMMGTLQRHGFQWDDMSLAMLRVRYPGMPVSSLKWWTNEYQTKAGVCSSYCIGRNKWLKEFVTENPPWFPISHRCCTYAKKVPAARSVAESGCDVRLVGTRRSEGGVRALAGTCFDRGASGKVDSYRPLYWLTDEDRRFYDQRFGIGHSECYARWGFSRTGCVGCPFNMDVFEDLGRAEAFEPKLVGAARKVFADSHEYTRMYREFRKRKEAESRGQMALFV